MITPREFNNRINEINARFSAQGAEIMVLKERVKALEEAKSVKSTRNTQKVTEKA